MTGLERSAMCPKDVPRLRLVLRSAALLAGGLGNAKRCTSNGLAEVDLDAVDGLREAKT
jgi:hypothetical protein